MSAVCFVDSNILVYSRDASEPDKQPKAHEWLARLWAERCGRISVQVLSEYFVTVTSKLVPGLPPEEAWRDVTNLFAWRPLPIDARLLGAARVVQLDFGFSWWDSLIVAAAKTSDCDYLLTEDIQDGQDLGGMIVINPLKHVPGEILASPS